MSNVYDPRTVEHTYREYNPSDSLAPANANQRPARSNQAQKTTKKTNTASNISKQQRTSSSSSSAGKASAYTINEGIMMESRPETLYTSDMSLMNARSAPSSSSGEGRGGQQQQHHHHSGGAAGGGSAAGIRTKQPSFKAHKFSQGLPSSVKKSAKSLNQYDHDDDGGEEGGYNEYEYDGISDLADEEEGRREDGNHGGGGGAGRHYELRSPDESMLSDSLHPSQQTLPIPISNPYAHYPYAQPSQSSQPSSSQAAYAHTNNPPATYQQPQPMLSYAGDPFQDMSAGMYEFDDSNVQLTDLIE
jgi:hypothetical protein